MKHWLSAIGTGQDMMATTYQDMARTLYGCACGQVRWTNAQILAHIKEANDEEDVDRTVAAAAGE